MEKIDLVDFYDNEILPNLPLEHVYSSLNPTDKGAYFAVDCPRCGKKGKAYVYKNRGILKCNRGGCGHLTDPVKHINGGTSPTGKAWIETIEKLAALANVALPEREWSQEDMLKHAVQMRKKSLREEFHDIAIHALNTDGYPAGRDYLKGRGWSSDNINQYEFGYYPSNFYIAEELKKRGYSYQEIDSSGLNKDTWNGRVVGPIRNLRHEIVSFFARDTTGKAERKLLYQDKESGASLDVPLGLCDAKSPELIVVEGMFDYLTLKAHGIKNVIALGSSNLSDGHVKSLQQAKVKSITLLLDNDKVNHDTTNNELSGLKSTRTIIEKHANADFEIYVIPPEQLGNAKDPDEFVRKNGVEALKPILKNVQHSFRYMADYITKQCNKSGLWTDAEKIEELDFGNRFEQRITNPRRLLSMSFFWESFVEKTGIDQYIVDQHRAQIQEKKTRDAKDKLFKAITDKLTTLSASGDFDGIEKELHSANEQLKEIGLYGAQGLVYLIEPNSRDWLVEEFSTEIPAISTGYTIGDRDLAFPAGALSILAGPTGHGKTTALGNFVLGTVNTNPNVSVYFLTYEESAHHITAKLLNTYASLQLNNGNNRGALYHYFNDPKSDPYKYINDAVRKAFKEKETAFFDTLMNTGRLKVQRPDMPIERLVEAITFIKRNDPKASLIVIDYVQLLETQKPSGGQRHEDMKAICKQLRECAIETGLAIVLGAQFNRDVQREEDMNQFKIAEAHNIAQEAELIIGLWNRSHNPLNPSLELFLKVLKGRNIGFGHNSVMSFDGNIGKISNMSPSASNETFAAAVITPAPKKPAQIYRDMAKDTK